MRTQLQHAGILGMMVLCVVFGCSKRSGRDKDVSFTRYLKSSLLKVKTSRNRVEKGFVRDKES